MQLINQEVNHIKFGNGTVVDMGENNITVRFTQGDKKFLYPDSFSKFMVLQNKKCQAQVEDILSKRDVENEKELRESQEERARQQRLSSLRITSNSQAVFGFIENTEDQVFSSWNISSGKYQSGSSKGAPKIPHRLKPNSACLLTRLPAGAHEKKRTVIGAFMVPDDFRGELCLNGQIPSHPHYRLALPEKNPIYLWDYFSDRDRPLSWGKVEMKYCTNLIAKDILSDIANAAEGTPLQELSAEFYQYFCDLNRL